MSSGKKACNPGTAHRFLLWLLPPHRREWGEAMLNEVPHIASRGAARNWVLGCTLAAFRERVAFELGRTFMTRRIFKVMLVMAGLLLVVAVGTYFDLKPYQRERIWITVRDTVHPGETARPVPNRSTPEGGVR